MCQVLCESQGAQMGSEGSPPPPDGGGPQLIAPHLPSPRLLPGALVHTAGCRVRIPAEVLILNSIVLPHKELSRSFTNQIIL